GQHLLEQGQFSRRDAGVEFLGAHKVAQRQVGLQGSARRTDADRLALHGSQQAAGLVGRYLHGACRVVGARHAHADALFAVDVTGTETALVADEVAVDLVIEAVHHATQRPVAFTGGDVAAHAAGGTDRGSGLQVPLARVVLAEHLVGEYTRRADLGEVATELAFQRTVLEAAEVGVVV